MMRMYTRPGSRRLSAPPQLPLTWVAFAALIGLGVLPFVLSTYSIITATQILAMSMLVLSLVVLMGNGGMISLGQAALFGVGGYTVGLLAVRLTDNILALIVLAVGVSTLVAGLVALILLRAKSVYFLMLTLALGELITIVAITWVDVTGGSDGLANIPVVTVAPGVALNHPAYVYWFVAAVVVLATLGITWVLRSPYGATLRGIRENEQRMRALGYSTQMYKFSAICFSGAIAGLGGALWVVESRFIAPGDMGFHASAFALLALIIGGSSSIGGAFFGAGLIIVVQNMLPLSLQGYGPLILGAVLIVAVYLMPRGVSGLVWDWMPRRERGGER